MEKTPKNDTENCSETKIRIEISSYRSLLEILGKTRSVLKVVGALLILVFTVFIGLAFVTISIKRIYPYNDIKTNAFGATTMQNEDIELTYWLFNTAEIWANSGIKVNAGDVLTIRASGKSHTAIHHLVKNVEQNNCLSENWSSTDGRTRDGVRDKYRMNYRIFPDKPQDALIMQVVDDSNINFSELSPKSSQWKYLTYRYVDGYTERMPDQLVSCIDYGIKSGMLNPSAYVTDRHETADPDIEKRREDFYFIGKERIDIHINHSGTLYFAVNDVVLTNKAIDAMNLESDQRICDTIKQAEPEKYNKFVTALTNMRKNPDMVTMDRDNEILWHKYNKNYFYFGSHPEHRDTVFSGYNEMTYYKDNNYYNAWFDDNVGSFLIVVERRKSK